VNVVRQAARDFRLPDDVTELDQWVLWRVESGREVPYSAKGSRSAKNQVARSARFSGGGNVIRRRPLGNEPTAN